jgi:hypothetical protein
MLKQDIKQNTPDTVEESTNLISDDNSVFFEQESVGDIASQIPVDESTYIPAFGKAVAKPEVQNLWSQYQQASIENNKTVDLTQAEFEALSTEEQETIIYQIKNCK